MMQSVDDNHDFGCRNFIVLRSLEGLHGTIVLPLRISRLGNENHWIDVINYGVNGG